MLLLKTRSKKVAKFRYYVVDPTICSGSWIRDGLELNGMTFNALVIGTCDQITDDLAKVLSSRGIPVYFVERLPRRLIRGTRGEYESFEASDNIQAVPLADLPQVLADLNVDRVEISPAWKALTWYHYIKDRQIFVFMNEDPDHTFTGTVTLPTEAPVVFYDAMDDCYEEAEYEIRSGHTVVSLTLERGHSCVLMEKKDIVPVRKHLSSKEKIRALEKMDISNNWTVSRARAIDYPSSKPRR